MAFEAKTIDEEVAGLTDSFDSAIAPKSVWRDNNNKLYLVLKSIGAGFSKIRDIVMALKYRFDARFCDDDDLESAMFITGETRIAGKASIIRMIASNTDFELEATMAAGTYVYMSSEGQPFLYTTSADITIPPGQFIVLLFFSRDVGAFEISGEASASAIREDGRPVSALLEFEALENAGSLGRAEETNFDIRQRILTDTTRQDTIRELELALRALPNIFECNLIFNPNDGQRDDQGRLVDGRVTLEDGTVLEPKELLIILTGAPNEDVANTVMSRTFYKTHMNTFDEVIWYYNPLLATGRYPVYFMFHKKKQFYLTINYVYDRQKMQKEQVDAWFDALYRKYKTMTSHIDEINEPLIYNEFCANSCPPGVSVRKIYIQEMVDASLESVARIEIPRLMLPELVSISYIAEEN